MDNMLEYCEIYHESILCFGLIMALQTLCYDSLLETSYVIYHILDDGECTRN